jgi:hypothetical protein
MLFQVEPLVHILFNDTRIVNKLSPVESTPYHRHTTGSHLTEMYTTMFLARGKRKISSHFLSGSGAQQVLGVPGGSELL